MREAGAGWTNLVVIGWNGRRLFLQTLFQVFHSCLPTDAPKKNERVMSLAPALRTNGHIDRAVGCVVGLIPPSIEVQERLEHEQDQKNGCTNGNNE
jgi:hypothetical protein